MTRVGILHPFLKTPVVWLESDSSSLCRTRRVIVMTRVRLLHPFSRLLTCKPRSHTIISELRTTLSRSCLNRTGEAKISDDHLRSGHDSQITTLDPDGEGEKSHVFIYELGKDGRKWGPPGHAIDLEACKGHHTHTVHLLYTFVFLNGLGRWSCENVLGSKMVMREFYSHHLIQRWPSESFIRSRDELVTLSRSPSCSNIVMCYVCDKCRQSRSCVFP